MGNFSISSHSSPIGHKSQLHRSNNVHIILALSHYLWIPIRRALCCFFSPPMYSGKCEQYLSSCLNDTRLCKSLVTIGLPWMTVDRQITRLSLKKKTIFPSYVFVLILRKVIFWIRIISSDCEGVLETYFPVLLLQKSIAKAL